MQLRFASYNIHKGIGVDRRCDPDRILAVLREVDADVIALQEADQRFGERASVLPRAAIGDSPWKVVPVARRPRSIGWHGNAILVRRDITVTSAGALHLPTLEPRGAVTAELQKGGASFRVVGTHLDLSGVRRRDQIHAVLGHVGGCERQLACLVMGDFNQWSSRGAMAAFGPDWTCLAPGRSFPSRRPLAPLDRIAISRGWRADNQDVHHSALAAQASDHLPVWAELTLVD